MHLCFYYLCRIVVSSWWIICIMDTKCPSLSLLISFGEVCLSNTLIISWLYFLGLSFSYSFTLRYLSLMLRYLSWRQQNYGSCFLIPFACLSLSIGGLRTFLLLVITDICVLIPVFLMILWYLLRPLLISFPGSIFLFLVSPRGFSILCTAVLVFLYYRKFLFLFNFNRFVGYNSYGCNCGLLALLIFF